MMIEFTIPIKPMAKERPRLTKNGGVFTPPKTRAFESTFREYTKIFLPHLEPTDKPLVITIFLMFKPTAKQLKDDPSIYSKPCTPHGDWDNLAKSVCDALNKVAYMDDKQIVEAHVYKFYNKSDGIKVRINEWTYRGGDKHGQENREASKEANNG